MGAGVLVLGGSVFDIPELGSSTFCRFLVGPIDRDKGASCILMSGSNECGDKDMSCSMMEDSIPVFIACTPV